MNPCEHLLIRIYNHKHSAISHFLFEQIGARKYKRYSKKVSKVVCTFSSMSHDWYFLSHCPSKQYMHFLRSPIRNSCSEFSSRSILNVFCFVGFPAEQTVYLVNEEEKAFNFSFDKDSCRADAHAAQLLIEPMSGSVRAKTR